MVTLEKCRTVPKFSKWLPTNIFLPNFYVLYCCTRTYVLIEARKNLGLRIIIRENSRKLGLRKSRTRPNRTYGPISNRKRCIINSNSSQNRIEKKEHCITYVRKS